MGLEGLSGGIIVSLVDFVMVFLILGGLAWAVKGLEKFVAFWENKQPASTPVAQVAPTLAMPEALPPIDVPAHLAAVTAAICDYTGLTPGSFVITKFEPIGYLAPVPGAPVDLSAHLAAMTAAISSYTGLQPGSFKIDSLRPLNMPYWVTHGSNMIAEMSEAQVAAITAAIYDFLHAPAGSLRITGITPVESVNAWKIAGRMELMNNRG